MDGTRVILLMCRGKDGGPNKEYKRRVSVLISHNKEQLIRNIGKCLAIKDASVDPLRLYMTLNSRNIVKAERNFKEQMLEMDYQSPEMKKVFYERLEGNWVSALMKPSARDTTYFMIDVDNEEGRDMFSEHINELNRLNVEIVQTYNTKNGHHIITKPFNPNTYKYASSINKDGQVLLSY